MFKVSRAPGGLGWCAWHDRGAGCWVPLDVLVQRGEGYRGYCRACAKEKRARNPETARRYDEAHNRGRRACDAEARKQKALRDRGTTRIGHVLSILSPRRVRVLFEDGSQQTCFAHTAAGTDSCKSNRKENNRKGRRLALVVADWVRVRTFHAVPGSVNSLGRVRRRTAHVARFALSFSTPAELATCEVLLARVWFLKHPVEKYLTHRLRDARAFSHTLKPEQAALKIARMLERGQLSSQKTVDGGSLLRENEGSPQRKDNMKHPFDYHQPSPTQTQQIQTVREACKALHTVLLALPPARERSLAITKLEEVSMWANKGVVMAEEGAVA